jgi:single-strand DNA-binding protein
MLNQVQLIGYIGKDPESRTFDTGTKKASFTMATTETRKNKKGEKVEDTQWHNIVCWDSLAEIAQKYFKKGQQVYVHGKIQTRAWDANDGSKRFITEIVAGQILALGKRESRPDPSASNDPFFP